MRILTIISFIICSGFFSNSNYAQTEIDSIGTEKNLGNDFISRGQLIIGAGNYYSFNKNIFNTDQKISGEPLFTLNVLLLYDYSDLFSIGVNINGSLQNIENQRFITDNGYLENQLTFYTIHLGGRAQWFYPRQFTQPYGYLGGNILLGGVTDFNDNIASIIGLSVNGGIGVKLNFSEDISVGLESILNLGYGFWDKHPFINSNSSGYNDTYLGFHGFVGFSF